MKGIRFGLLPKLLICFLALSVTPLLILGYVAHGNLKDTGFQAAMRAEEMGVMTLGAARDLGSDAIRDSENALIEKSTEAIELRTEELAARIADFLYERDRDILFIASIQPNAQTYLNFYNAFQKSVITADSPSEEGGGEEPSALKSANPENRQAWRHRRPYGFQRILSPLYKEITFVDIYGMERIKISEGKVSSILLDISKRENTYCKAEDYFPKLQRLEREGIYVSGVVGAYVKGWLYETPEGIKVRRESAYAGKENPGGRKFEGIIRWATPLFDEKGKKLGYVTLALDHIHLMEFTEHVAPSEARFSALSDAGSGNYAFIWDNRDRSIVHPRHFFIMGYDPETGREVPGWVSQETYDAYKSSGMDFDAFMQLRPHFSNFTQKKRGAREQSEAGVIGLDCRALDMAPQCQGWHEGTEDGGSGSFLILWSGLRKLTTYAAIPYYTGDYGTSKRGFGYVTIGANVDEFYKAAVATKARIENSINKEAEQILETNNRSKAILDASVSQSLALMAAITVFAVFCVVMASFTITMNITKPIKELTKGAKAMREGDLEQSINVSSSDEIGDLAVSFNEMAKAIREVDRMKSEFVTIASHELRTPIQAMLLGISGVLEGYSGSIDEEVREDLELARSGIERLMRLVEDLLDLARIEAHKIELSFSAALPGDLIEKALNEIGDLARAHNHDVIVGVSNDLPPVMVDRDRMVQALINLISNAIKYTPDNGKIIVEAARDGDAIVFSVIDNGYGIPVWAQEEVFKKFFQADSVMSHRVGGSGLGLTITKGIVEEHGGRIVCRSPVDPESVSALPLGGVRLGSAFYLYVPLSIS